MVRSRGKPFKKYLWKYYTCWNTCGVGTFAKGVESELKEALVTIGLGRGSPSDHMLRVEHTLARVRHRRLRWSTLEGHRSIQAHCSSTGSTNRHITSWTVLFVQRCFLFFTSSWRICSVTYGKMTYTYLVRFFIREMRLKGRSEGFGTWRLLLAIRIWQANLHLGSTWSSKR